MDVDGNPIVFSSPSNLVLYTHVVMGGVWSFYETKRMLSTNIVFKIHDEPIHEAWRWLRHVWMSRSGELLSSVDTEYFKPIDID